VVALGLIVFVATVAYADRGGYRDSAGNAVNLIDAFYYATVSITTTGYGDVIPITDRSRLLTTILITPARILFLILLVGTTLEVLAETSRTAIRERAWRRKLRDHIIVCGYGTKGRSAIDVLLGKGHQRSEIVVIDATAERVAEATQAGFAAVHGDSTRTAILVEAAVGAASAIIVATDRDDAAVLTTLTAREHNARAEIIAAVREDENRHLLRQSGANSVITSSEAAGLLLGFAAFAPRVVEVLEDLLSVGTGLDLVERAVPQESIGRPLSMVGVDAPVLAVVRAEQLLRFDSPELQTLKAGDLWLCLCSNPDPLN